MEIFNSKGQLELFIPVIEKGSWRNKYIDTIFEEVNNERKGTKYKPVTKARIAILTSHLKTEQDLSYLVSIAKDTKRRGGSFGKVIFGSLKVK